MYDNDECDLDGISDGLRELLTTQEALKRRLDDACDDDRETARAHREDPCAFTLRQRLAAARKVAALTEAYAEATQEVEDAWREEFRPHW